MAVKIGVAASAFLGGLILSAPTVADAAHRVSVAYCEKFKDGSAAYFIAKERPDGDLDFSLSAWTSNGQHAGLGGTAGRGAEGWVYRSMDNASQPGRPCVARIHISQSGALRVTATPLDACDGEQGYGATVGDIGFDPSAYVGPSPSDPFGVEETDLGPKCKW